MENVVAVAIDLDNGESRYFLTWGRIFDTVDGSRLEELALKAASHVQLAGTAIGARLCDSLQEAAHERYFFECFFEMAQNRIPRGADYESWKAERARALMEGREWCYLGVARPPAS